MDKKFYAKNVKKQIKIYLITKILKIQKIFQIAIFVTININYYQMKILKIISNKFVKFVVKTINLKLNKKIQLFFIFIVKNANCFLDLIENIRNKLNFLIIKFKTATTLVNNVRI